MRRSTMATLLLVAAAAPGFLRTLAPSAKLAAALARTPYAARRARVNGAVWTSAAEIARRFTAPETIPMILRSRRDVDRSVFVAYYLYPRVVKGYWGLDEYRAKGVDPRGEKPVAYVDVTRNDGARVMTYAAIRHEQIYEGAPLASAVTSAPFREAIVPFAAAFDGAPPDAYMTTLALAAHDATTVTLTLEPLGAATRLTLRAGETRVLRDAVYDGFGRFATGWIRISAAAPIRAGAFLVNRGRSRVAAVPIVTAVEQRAAILTGGDHLFLLNPSDADVSATVNGAAIRVAPHALASVGAQPAYDVRASAPLFAFSARKLPDGNTSFGWP